MSEKYLTYKDVMEMLELGKSTVCRRVEDGTLPKPIRIGKLARFRRSELLDALQRLDLKR